MTKKSTLYFNFDITSLSDIDTLIALIKDNGRFTYSDYYCIYRKAQLCSQSTQIIYSLEKQVKPLLKTHTGAVFKDSSKSLIEERRKEELKKFFSISHKAKEFRVKDGVITINGFSLFSTRITKVHPSWLLNIEHEFHITQEYNKKNQFHFVPFSDLSLLLNETERLIKEKNHSKVYSEILEDWPNDFYRFMEFPSKIKTANYSPDTSCIEYITSVNGNSHDFLYIPLNDVIVYDGEITINFENTEVLTENIILKDNLKKELVKDISWNKFKEYLSSIYREDSIEFYTQELESLYKQQLDVFITEIRGHRPKTFQTYLTKEHFLKIYGVNNKCYLKCNSNAVPIWSIDEMSPMFAAMGMLVNKQYTISEHTKCELRKAKSQFEAVFNSPLSNLIYPIKKILNYFDTDRTYYLREVTDSCWLKRDLPQYSDDISKYVIVYFNEIVSHCSDDEWDTSSSFKSYLIWPRERDCSSIFMHPTNKEYSDYTFYIDTNKCSLEFAAIIISRYFNSEIKNKRQNIKNNTFFKQLGIYSVSKIIIVR